jgi:hypothetical protein
MSFSVGVSADDIKTIGTLAWKLYKSCKEASEEFVHISHEVANLHIALKETEEYLNETLGLSPTRDAKLGFLIQGIKDALQDLEKMLDEYESLGTQAQRTWVSTLTRQDVVVVLTCRRIGCDLE